MDGYYTVSEYAKVSGKDPGNIRRNLINGTLAGEKLGNQWIIPKESAYPEDKRVKNGAYKNQRKKTALRRSLPGFMNSIEKMCDDIGSLYGTDLNRIVLYGSYARGEHAEESDVDIALILNETDSEKVHDAMNRIVVDYELDLGVTLSVITIEEEHYAEWKKYLPFYKNIDKEGIILWKTT